MTSSPFPVVVLSDTESDDDDAALSRIPAESFSSSLATQAEIEALCQKHGVPSQFAASPAGERRACTPPPPRAVCVYAHMLEAGLRFPLHDFFSEALFHFGLAPGQLTPNGWRVLVCFVVLCRSAGVPPTIAVFRHFFSLRTRGWCFFRCRKGVGALVTGLTSRKSEKEWKRGFFFLKSPEQWSCPVHWGEPPSGNSIPRLVLSRKDRESVEKLEHTQGVPVDLRTYLSASNLAAAFSSTLAGASPAPPLEPFPRSTGSKGMKAEPIGDTMQFSGKKRKQEEVAGAGPNTPRAPTALSVCLAAGLPSPPGYDPNPRHIPVPDTHDGDSADWGEARKVLESILTPSRQREFAAAKPSDVVASTYLAIREAMSSVPFSLGHALELEEKQTAQERDAAALREQLEEVKAELTTVKQESEAKLTAVKQESEAKLEKLRAELAAARRAMEAEVESAKTAAVQKFLRSEEYRRRVAGQALPAYEQGAEDMKRVALRLVPSRDAAKLVLPLD